MTQQGLCFGSPEHVTQENTKLYSLLLRARSPHFEFDVLKLWMCVSACDWLYLSCLAACERLADLHTRVCRRGVKALALHLSDVVALGLQATDGAEWCCKTHVAYMCLRCACMFGA